MAGAGRTAATFAGIYAAGVAAHCWALHLPYYWDEAGYFVPAALDLARHGWWVPHSTLANGHPPLVMALLALAWQLAGYKIWAARAVMLGFYAGLIAGAWQLAKTLFGTRAAIIAALLIAFAPLVFAQAPLAQLDLPAAALIIGALAARYRRRPALYLLLAAAACLAKETAVLLPFALALADMLRAARTAPAGADSSPRKWRRMALAVWPHAAAALPLLGWLAYYHALTGYWFGNAGFLAYNLDAASSAPRIVITLLRRVWQLFGYNGAWLLTGLGLWGWRRRARARGESARRSERWPHPPAAELAGLIAIYLLFHSAIGGAVLTRYLLPAEAALIVLAAGGLSWLPRPQLAAAACLLLFCLNWFWRPPYAFPYEDNLAYVNFVHLQQAAARRLATLPSSFQPVLTAWPATDELSTPALGYVRQPLRVAPVRDFNPGALQRLPAFGSALLYSRRYRPPLDLLNALPLWRRWIGRYFHYQPELGRRALLRQMKLRVVWQKRRRGQWVLIAAAK